MAQEDSETGKSLDPTLKRLVEIDRLIAVEVSGTLAGLALAAASFLFSETRGYVREQLRIQETARDANRDAGVAVPPQILAQIANLQRQIVNVDDGTRYLLRAFYVFLGNLISLLVFLDSSLEPELSTTIDGEIVSLVFEGIPFGLGISFLIAGANYIRAIYGLRI